MSVTFSDVKAITIPEGSVKQIESGGVVLWSASRLPSAYQEVEYIGSTGSAYIDSGIECTSDLIVHYKFLYTTTANAAVCGGISTANAPTYFRHHCTPINSRVGYWMMYSSSNGSNVTTTAGASEAHEVCIDPTTGTSIVDDTTESFTAITGSYTTGRSYGIMARISNTGAIQSKPSQFYWFKFYRNGSLIGDFVPCYRIADSVAGMYDLVSGTFLTNAGSGSFVVGGDV